MWKVCSLSVSSGRSSTWEQMPTTSHTPQIFASYCFLSRNNESNVISHSSGKRIWTIHFDFGLSGVLHQSKSTWMIFLSFVLTTQPWKWTSLQRGRHRISLSLTWDSFRYFLKQVIQCHQLVIDMITQPPYHYLILTIDGQSWMCLSVDCCSYNC